MQNNIDATETFRRSIDPFLMTWQSIMIRAVLDLKGGQVLSLIACLSPDLPIPLEEIQPIVRDVLFVRGALPLSELNSFLNGWVQSSIQIGDRLFTTSPFSQRQFMELAKPWDDLTSGWPELSNYRHLFLYATGPDLNQLAKSHNLEAMATALGFRSFAEMADHRLQFQVGQSHYTRVEIFAPILATIEITFAGKEIQIYISAQSAIQTSDMHVSYRLQDQRGNRISGNQLTLSEFSAATHGDFNIMQYSLPVLDNVSSGEVNLFHLHYHNGDEPLMTKSFIIPPLPGKTNPRWELIRSLVSNTRSFMAKRTDVAEVIKEDWLGLGSKQVDEGYFNRGMSCLLFAAGFSKLSIGSELEGVDEAIQIADAAQIAILLSYTTGPQVGTKARKLKFQVEQLRRNLQDYKIYAAVVIPKDERDLFVRDIEDCKQENIGLILRPELEQMVLSVSGKDWQRAKDTFINLLTK